MLPGWRQYTYNILRSLYHMPSTSQSSSLLRVLPASFAHMQFYKSRDRHADDLPSVEERVRPCVDVALAVSPTALEHTINSSCYFWLGLQSHELTITTRLPCKVQKCLVTICFISPWRGPRRWDVLFSSHCLYASSTSYTRTMLFLGSKRFRLRLVITFMGSLTVSSIHSGAVILVVWCPVMSMVVRRQCSSGKE